MKNVKILFITAVLLSTAGVGLAQDEEKKLGITFDLTYMSKWMSRGVECYSEDGAFFETIGLDLWGTGFKIAVTHASSTGDGWVNKQRLDYMVSYGNSIFDDTPYKMKFTIGYAYKNYYHKLANAAGRSKDCQTWTLKYSFPNLFGETGLVPYGVTTYDAPAHTHDGYNNHWDGWVHRFGLKYNLKIPDVPSPLHLSSEVAYTDGFRAADHDWSYATLGASMKFKITKKMAIVPALYYQISMDDSVSDHDIAYCKISMKYKF